jgi:hypothetical protein
MDVGRFEVRLPSDAMPLLAAKYNEIGLSSDALYLYPYIKNDVLSFGRAAQILGISKFELIKIYSEYDIPYLDMTMDELEKDIATIDLIRGVVR